MRLITTFLLFIFIFFEGSAVYSQDTLKKNTTQPLSIYFNNPISMTNKIRVKFEARIDQHSAFLVSMTKYYGIWPGYNTSIEFKHYGDKKYNNYEKIMYLKWGWGASLTDGFSPTPNITRGKYMFMGGGLGQHYTLGKTRSFFIEFTEGVKFTRATSGEVDLAPN